MNMLQETQTRLSYEIALYREQMIMLQKEMERISLTMLDISNALRTVENLRNDNSFIPIGGGAYIKGMVEGDQVIVPIGAEYMVEMERGEARIELSRRVDSTKKAVERLKEEFDKISIKLRDVAERLKGVEVSSRIDKQVEESASDDYI